MTPLVTRPALITASALVLAACAQPSEAPPAPAEVPTADSFLTDLRRDYPVTLSELAPGVWVHTTVYRIPGQNPIPVNGLVVVDGEAVTLVDGAWGELATVALIDRVEAETGLPVTRMIVTHHHADRTQGVDAAERHGVQVFTHPDTPALAARMGWPVPNTSVAALGEEGARIKVGKVEVGYPGPGHAPDNLVAYLPDEKILYAGCFLRGAGVESLGNVEDADLAEWRENLLWVKGTYRNAETVVPGHGKGADILLVDATARLIDARMAAEAED